MAAHAEVAKFAPRSVSSAPRVQQRSQGGFDAKPLRSAVKWLLIVAALAVAGVLVWQGVTASGAPDPTKAGTGRGAAIMDIGVLVFREGLECILVLAALTASMTGEKSGHRKPVVAGAGVAFLATIVTWFIAVGILSDLGDSVSALNLQWITGMLAILVLLVVMNWFFHKIYWGGWISLHNRKKKELLNEMEEEPTAANGNKLWLGLAMLGFASLYREGFEVVLFLQGYFLKMGGMTVLMGAAVGLGLSGIVAALTFIGQQRLPYRKMLIFTGVLLGAVLLVMVGEEVQEMQLAHWMSTTNINWLVPVVPDWAGVWFAVFPTVETLAAQGVAVAVVAGSYFVSRKMSRA